MKLVYTDEAIDDMKRLRDFIAAHNPSAAARIATELLERIERLAEFPHMGTPVEMAPEPDTVRDMVFDKYIVRYSIHTSVTIILRIWHGLEGERWPITMDKQNLWQELPDARAAEQFTELLNHHTVRIERIVSQGQSSPEGFWYDQEEHEWVLLLQGSARLELEGGKSIPLEAGDTLTLPAHTRHRLAWTDPDKTTIWLAVFYR